jgi:hypothetical protein
LHAIKQIRKYLEKNPASESALALAQFATALSEEREFSLAELYRLNYEAFDLAIDLLKDWRFDRYYAGEINLFDAVLNGAPPQAPLAA